MSESLVIVRLLNVYCDAGSVADAESSILRGHLDLIGIGLWQINRESAVEQLVADPIAILTLRTSHNPICSIGNCTTICDKDVVDWDVKSATIAHNWAGDCLSILAHKPIAIGRIGIGDFPDERRVHLGAISGKQLIGRGSRGGSNLLNGYYIIHLERLLGQLIIVGLDNERLGIDSLAGYAYILPSHGTRSVTLDVLKVIAPVNKVGDADLRINHGYCDTIVIRAVEV